MTERALPLADGAAACPFVAFEDDRDERASVPDHRHRCYAEPRPAPRAIAHQEAYCLSSAFPVCPTFQDWARREAARARGGATSAAAFGASGGGSAGDADALPDSDRASAATAGRADDSVGSAGDGGSTDVGAGLAAGSAAASIAAGARRGEDGGSDAAGEAAAADEADVPDESDGALREPAMPGSDPDPVRRNPPRDWSAPPPWLASAEGRVGPDDSEPPPFLGRRSEPGQGLAGSPADRLAGGSPPSRRPQPGEEWSDGDVAEEVGVARAGVAVTPRTSRPTTPLPADADWAEGDEEAPQRRITRRPRAYDQHLGGPDGPDWEKPRRYEAYPTIRTRVGMPQIPRLAVIAGVIVLLAIALFFLPGLLKVGGRGTGPAASSSAGPARSVASLAPTVAPAATPVVYTLKHGDTLSKIAAKNGLTMEELLAANPSIKNPNKVAEGQQIVIPSASEAPPQQVGGSASPSAAP